MFKQIFSNFLYVIFWVVAGAIFSRIGCVCGKIMASKELDYYKTYEWINYETTEDYWVIIILSILNGGFAIIDVILFNMENIQMLFFIGLISLVSAVVFSYFFEIYDKKFIHKDKKTLFTTNLKN